MSAEVTYCEGCGEALMNYPAINGRRRKRRKWCSDSCRKRTRYYSECIDCGARVAYASGANCLRLHRCAECASANQTIWTRDAIVTAIQEYAEECGRPPTAAEWNPAFARSKNMAFASNVGDRWPYSGYVQTLFGSWNAGIEAAGFTPLRCGGGRRTDR